MILETERLVLRPIEPADWRVLYPIMSDPVVMAHWDSTEVEDPDVVEQMIAAQVDDMAAGRACYWAVELSGDHTFVGACDLSEIDWRHHRGEVGFLLANGAGDTDTGWRRCARWSTTPPRWV